MASLDHPEIETLAWKSRSK